MSTVLTPAPQTETTSIPTQRPTPRTGSPLRRTPTDPSERRIWLILLGTLALAAFCVGMFLQQPRFRHTDTPISEIQLGANVPGSNPSEADDLTFGDSIDPDSWKMVRLTAQQGDGTLVEISLLRPDSWLAERNAVAGSVVDGLEFGRLGVVGDATVETIAACPPIRPGPGRTVTGIYRHFGQQVLDLRTANGEEIGVTPDHRFWSADRREFVQAGDLHPGETLNLLDGTTTVTSITQRPSGEPVYTLEVHVEHVFHVAKSGVLVHNCNITPWPKGLRKSKPYSVDEICSRDCVKDAQRIREALGRGEIKRINTSDHDDLFLGPINLPDGGTIPGNKFFFHEVVLDGNRVYDSITGPRGMPLDEYKSMFDDSLVDILFRNF